MAQTHSGISVSRLFSNEYRGDGNRVEFRMREFAGAVLAVLALVGMSIGPVAVAEPGGAWFPVGAVIAGESPDQLGDWIVRYERLGGPDPVMVHRINEVIDAEARGQVATYEPSATKTHPWTLDVNGALTFREITVSALFTGEYDTDLPNMPIHTVGTRVFDNRSGILIDWDNLFVDKSAGLARLSELTKTILPTVYAPPRRPGVWQFGSEIAPVDDNFRFWIPTAGGIELHFPDGQFGRGTAVITVPWAGVADLIAPEFAPITA